MSALKEKNPITVDTYHSCAKIAFLTSMKMRKVHAEA